MLRGEAMSWNTCLKGQNVFTYKLVLQSKPKAVVCQFNVKIFFSNPSLNAETAVSLPFISVFLSKHLLFTKDLLTNDAKIQLVLTNKR